MKLHTKTGNPIQAINSSITMQKSGEYTYSVYLSADGETYTKYADTDGTDTFDDDICVINGLTPNTYVKFGETADNIDLVIIY